MLSPVDVPGKTLNRCISFGEETSMTSRAMFHPGFLQVMPEGLVLSLEKKFLHSSTKSPGYKDFPG